MSIDENFLAHIFFGTLRSEYIIYWCMKCDCKYSLLYIMSIYLLSSSVPKLLIILNDHLSTGSSPFPQYYLN